MLSPAHSDNTVCHMITVLQHDLRFRESKFLHGYRYDSLHSVEPIAQRGSRLIYLTAPCTMPQMQPVNAFYKRPLKVSFKVIDLYF